MIPVGYIFSQSLYGNISVVSDKKSPIIYCSAAKSWGVLFPGPILGTNTMKNSHIHQPAPLSFKAGDILSFVLLVLGGALTLVTLAAS